MRPRGGRNANNAKSKVNLPKKTVTSPSDDDTAFQSPDHDNETDYGLEFTTSRLTTPRRLPSSTLNKSQQNLQRDTENDDDENEENQPPESSPTRRRSDRRSLQESSKDITTHQIPTKQQQAPQKHPATTRRKKTRPEHRLVKMQREINRLQAHTGYIIPRLPFSRLVREIMSECTQSVFMISVGALEALQMSTEMYLTQRFEDAYLLTGFRGRVTLEVRDMALVSYFCKTYGNN